MSTIPILQNQVDQDSPPRENGFGSDLDLDITTNNHHHHNNNDQNDNNTKTFRRAVYRRSRSRTSDSDSNGNFVTPMPFPFVNGDKRHDNNCYNSHVSEKSLVNGENSNNNVNSKEEKEKENENENDKKASNQGQLTIVYHGTFESSPNRLKTMDDEQVFDIRFNKIVFVKEIRVCNESGTNVVFVFLFCFFVFFLFSFCFRCGPGGCVVC